MGGCSDAEKQLLVTAKTFSSWGRVNTAGDDMRPSETLSSCLQRHHLWPSQRRGLMQHPGFQLVYATGALPRVDVPSPRAAMGGVRLPGNTVSTEPGDSQNSPLSLLLFLLPTTARLILLYPIFQLSKGLKPRSHQVGKTCMVTIICTQPVPGGCSPRQGPQSLPKTGLLCSWRVRSCDLGSTNMSMSSFPVPHKSWVAP